MKSLEARQVREQSIVVEVLGTWSRGVEFMAQGPNSQQELWSPAGTLSLVEGG
jgi:hypothetical protein